MERHSDNAEKVVEFLQGHDGVTAVHYPGLPDHPDHEELAALQAGDGDRRQLARFAAHVAGCESCAEVVAAAAYSEAGREQGNMGADFSDFDGNNLQDVAVTTFQDEATAIYSQTEPLLFSDVSDTVGVGTSSRARPTAAAYCGDGAEAMTDGTSCDCGKRGAVTTTPCVRNAANAATPSPRRSGPKGCRP